MASTRRLPDRIMQLGMGFWGSKTLLSAIELGLFTELAKGPLDIKAVTRRLQGYVVAPVDGDTLLNGEPLGREAVALQDGDTLELGGTRMQFVYG